MSDDRRALLPDTFHAQYDHLLLMPDSPVREALGLLALRRGDLDEARPLVAKHLPDPEAESVHARIEVKDWATSPDDGTLASAKRLAARGRWREALDGMLGALQDDRDAARQAMVTVFAALGDEDGLVPEYRRKLTAALF